MSWAYLIMFLPENKEERVKEVGELAEVVPPGHPQCQDCLHIHQLSPQSVKPMARIYIVYNKMYI